MQSFINILYISTLTSPALFDNVLSTSRDKPGQAAQKFHRLIVEGLASHNTLCKIETLSAIPVTAKSHKRRFWYMHSEFSENILYNYIPIINLPVLKEINVFLYSFIKTLAWNLRGKRNLVICDVLNLSNTAGALIASRISRTNVIAVVTDLPGLMISGSRKKNKLKVKIYIKILNYLLSSFNAYVLLTKQMNVVVNSFSKPYIIMEGLVDIKMKTVANTLDKKDAKRIIMYAGGIHEKYGIKKLIEAFMQLEDLNLRLHIYGAGDMELDMPIYCEKDPRIYYLGVISNEIVVKEQLRATLLINPRPSNLELAKYSFPSKNLEYMVSGTPVVTTLLPGMPVEYNDYVYIFEDETVEGFSKTLNQILSQPAENLMEFGIKAKNFALKNKNNIIQSERLLKII